MKRVMMVALACASVVAIVTESTSQHAHAQDISYIDADLNLNDDTQALFTPRKRQSRAEKAADLAQVCPPGIIQQIGKKFFYKNNKPIRAGSAINAPVIGQNNVITLAGQPGGPRIFRSAGTLYAINGEKIARLAPYPCRSDHCSGRVVSSQSTTALRKKAERLANSPAGYVKVGGVCIFIPHLGKCFGAHVNKSRPNCNKTL